MTGDSHTVTKALTAARQRVPPASEMLIERMLVDREKKELGYISPQPWRYSTLGGIRADLGLFYSIPFCGNRCAVTEDLESTLSKRASASATDR